MFAGLRRQKSSPAQLRRDADAVFSTPEGRRVLAYIATVGGVFSAEVEAAFTRPGAVGETLAYQTGQRQLALHILKLAGALPAKKGRVSDEELVAALGFQHETVNDEEDEP